MLTVVPDPTDGDRHAGGPVLSGSLIDEIVREGARWMPAEALPRSMPTSLSSRASAMSAAAVWSCGTAPPPDQQAQQPGTVCLPG